MGTAPVNEGNLSDDKTKTKAPVTANNILTPAPCSLTNSLIFLIPKAKKGSATAHQIPVHLIGRKPSAI
ncbi:hypothetical protein U472_08895 [Orenia metallireducens]|uniref:Uncharacterized protein n=1 Tax=Orenia metallireducens TaxID=1413210 RepID=A0A1C0A7B4_9FIRM|nr:hypothetical protein U472_08895 [Orenia metallireducens]